MPATRNGKTWRSQFYYEDWQGVRHKRTKEALRQKQKQRSGSVTSGNRQRKDLDINFENFVETILLMWRTGLEKAQSRIKDMCLI